MQPEISFSFGALRQPGIWGKILRPPNLFDGLLLIFGVKGFQQAGMLSSCFVLMKVKEGANLEWQFPGHLVRFGGKDVEFIGSGEGDLESIYVQAREAGYLDIDRVRQTLRNEGKDRGPQPKK